MGSKEIRYTYDYQSISQNHNMFSSQSQILHLAGNTLSDKKLQKLRAVKREHAVSVKYYKSAH